MRYGIATGVLTASLMAGAAVNAQPDVMFGAFLGMTSGRTVTVRMRRTPVLRSPVAVPGGGVAINVRMAE